MQTSVLALATLAAKALGGEIVLSYDCKAGYANWEKGWSDEKMDWCCKNEQRGCRDAQATTSAPYDCDAGLVNWEAGWSAAKKRWCCLNEGLGCETASVHTSWPIGVDLPGNTITTTRWQLGCEAAYANWVTGRSSWPGEKRSWCCTHKNVGCPFDCSTDSSASPQREWSVAQKAWCCQHKDVGCPKVASPSTAPAGEPRFAMDSTAAAGKEQADARSAHDSAGAAATSSAQSEIEIAEHLGDEYAEDRVLIRDGEMSLESALLMADSNRTKASTTTEPVSTSAKTTRMVITAGTAVASDQVSETGDASSLRLQQQMEEQQQQQMNNTALSERTKKIVGGVVGGSLGALTVGLLGGLLGKMTTTTTEIITPTVAMDVSTTTSTTTMMVMSTSAVANASSAVSNLTALAPQPSAFADISSAKLFGFPWWWIAPLVLLPLLAVCLICGRKCTDGAKKGPKKGREPRTRAQHQSVPSSPTPGSPSCEAPMLGGHPGAGDVLSPVPPFPLGEQSARTLGVSPGGAAKGAAKEFEAVEQSFVLPVGGGLGSLEGLRSAGSAPVSMSAVGQAEAYAQVSAQQVQVQQAHAQQAQAWAQAQAHAQVQVAQSRAAAQAQQAQAWAQAQAQMQQQVQVQAQAQAQSQAQAHAQAQAQAQAAQGKGVPKGMGKGVAVPAGMVPVVAVPLQQEFAGFPPQAHMPYGL